MCSYEDSLEGESLGGFLSALMVSWVNMGILLVMFSVFFIFHKGTPWFNVGYYATFRCWGEEFSEYSCPRQATGYSRVTHVSTVDTCMLH